MASPRRIIVTKAQKIDQKKELESQAGMAEIDAGTIFGELEKEMPKKEATQEQKDSNPYQFKYEVCVKKLTKRLKTIKGLEVGKVGRVIEVLDEKTVLVDFWDTVPAKVPMKNIYLTLSRTREQVEIDAGIIPEKEEIVEVPVKFDQGKPRMDLIRPEFTLSIGQALGYGAEKYGEKLGDIPNYLKGDGFHYSKIIGSLERHIAEWKMGNNIDEESNIHHLALAAANIQFLLTYELTEKGVDDRVILGTKKRKASEKPEKAVKNTK
jgi:hypothetical protein